MPAWPDAPALRTFLSRAAARLAALSAARAAAIGLVFGALAAMVAWLLRSPLTVAGAVGLSVLMASAGAALGWWRARRRSAQVPALVEARAPVCNHLLITAAELLAEPARVTPYVGAIVCRDAARITNRLDLSSVFPAGRPLAMLAAAAFFCTAAIATTRAWPAPQLATPAGSSSSAGASSLVGVDITITPPAYVQQAATTIRNPTRVQALAGSSLRVMVRASAAAVDIETISGRRPLAADGQDRFAGDVVADADGFIVLQTSAADGMPGARRLIGLVVDRDRAPAARVTKPGRDLFFADPKRTLPIEIDAADDLGLTSLRVTYTRVTGSGENFEFKQGELPMQLTPKNPREWAGAGVLDLGRLSLEPGDMVVYRAVAADARPGATPVESDAFIVQIVAPGSEAAEGFAADDLKEKYALSQRMVIIKTERLEARRRELTAEAYAEESANISAEQRQVRAEFVFMLGGELGGEGGLDDLNEELEAAGEADLMAGRMQNRGRIDVLRAIRHMSAAVAALNAPDTTAALKSERAALDALQLAFSKSRYLLRALTQRESLDFSRRLSGVLEGADRRTRPAQEPILSGRLTDLRRALSRLAAFAAREQFTRAEASEPTLIGETILRADASSPALQDVAARLNAAADAIVQGSAGVSSLLDDAAIGLSRVIRAELHDAPRAPASPATRRLNGALTDALRGPKGSR